MNSEIEPTNIDDPVITKSRNDLVFSSQGAALLVICAAILVFAYFISDIVNLPALGIWTSVAIASYFIRYLLCRYYLKASDERKSSNSWSRLFTLSSGFTGLIWGIGAFVVFPEDSINYQMLMILLMVILSAASTVTHSAFRWASVSFTLACLVPLAVRLFLIEQSGYTEIGFFLLLFIFVMLSSGAFLWRMSNRMFTLTHENAKLVADLQRSNGKLLLKNEQLSQAKQELSNANDTLQKLATTDGLTNLTNRRKFEALTQVKWLRSEEEKTPLSLLLVNIDMFKQYNDFYGQRRGDSCLVQISDYLSQLPEINRNGDCVARYGGDEFAILLMNSDIFYARQVAERLRSEVEMLRISRAEMPHESSPWVSVSIGVACETEFGNKTFNDLFEQADQSLARAKREGRNRVWNHDDNSAAI